MSISENISKENQEVILRVLQKFERPLQLLELKKKSALANLYFFEGLKKLERNQLIQQTMIKGKTWISLWD